MIDEATIEVIAIAFTQAHRDTCYPDAQPFEAIAFAQTVVRIVEAALSKPPADAERAELVDGLRDYLQSERDDPEYANPLTVGLATEAAALITADGERIAALEAEVAQAREDALEEAAQVADTRAVMAREINPHDLQQANTADQIAERIRALKGPQT